MRIFLLAVLLSGCTTIERIAPGQFRIQEHLTVSADERWNRLRTPDGGELWTADGMALDTLAFYVVREGETLGADTSGDAPRWHSGMTPHDVVELYEGLVTQEGSVFRLERLAPATFGGLPGFLFEHTTATRDGPLLGGLAYCVVASGKLFVMSYTAPKSHFYEKHLSAVRAIAASARITIPGTAASASP